jgi:methyltransferase (TIGR00027 family)
LEQGRIFADPLALRILGDDAERVVREARENDASRRMRIFIAVRSRFAEDAAARAIADGVRQVVVLGAGLDTYACRGGYPDGVRVFELDHPATQAWKRERLAAARIAAPDALTFAPCDFERDQLGAALAAAGFDGAETAFFTWLGVVPYLTEDAIWSTLGYVASLAGGAQVVFDYSDPPSALPDDQRMAHDLRAARVADIGEAWITHFDPAALHVRLRALGFTEIEDLGPPAIAARYFPDRVGPARERGGHVVRAARFARGLR